MSLTNILFANLFLITEKFCTGLWQTVIMFSSLFNPALNELKPLCQHWCHMRTFLLRHFRSLECPTDHFMEIPGIWHTIFFVMTRFGVQTLRVTTFRSNISAFTFQVMYAYLHSSLVYTPFLSFSCIIFCNTNNQ